MSDCAPCTIQQLPPMDTLLMCAIGGLAALCIFLILMAVMSALHSLRRVKLDYLNARFKGEM